MAAPTFIEAEVAPFSTQKAGGDATDTTASTFTTQAGDVIVALSTGQDVVAVGTLTPSDGTNGYIQQAERTTADHCPIDVSTDNSATAGTFTGTITRGNTSLTAYFGAAFAVFRGSDGIGANVLSADAQSGSITTTQANSAIALIVADWSAASVAGWTWPNVNGAQPTEIVAPNQVAGFYTYAVAYYADAGTAGAKTVGPSAPTLGTPSIIAVEIKGTTGGASPALDDSGSFPGFEAQSNPLVISVW